MITRERSRPPGSTITLVSKETTDSPGMSTGTYGVMRFNVSSGEWVYTLDDRAEALADQQTATETFIFSAVRETFEVTITITGVNDAPTVSGEFFTREGPTGERFTLSNLSDQFTDVDEGDELTFTVTLDDGAALSTIGLTYDSDEDEITGTLPETGAYVIKIVATDKSGAMVEATFDPNILSAGPIIQRNSLTYNADATSITIDETMLEVTSGNASDPALLVYTITTLPDAGMLLRSGTQLNNGDTFTQADINNGLITYVPDVGSLFISQSNPLSFTISDGVVSLEATLEITSREVVGNTVYEGDLSTSGDLDVSDDTLLDSTTPFTISTQGTYGTASIGDDGEWVYKLDNGNADVRALNSGDTLTDTFVVDVNLASGRAKTQTVTITISGRTDVLGTNGRDSSLGDASTSDNQAIFGFNRYDILTGGSGDDLLVGGYGFDDIDLSAGGTDTVVYRIDARRGLKAEDGSDTVMEFTPGEDKLVILDVNGSPTTLADLFDSLSDFVGIELRIEGDYDYSDDLSSSELDAGARVYIQMFFRVEGTVDGGPTSAGTGILLRIDFDRVTSEALKDMAVWDTLTGGTNFSEGTISTVAQLSSLFGGFGRPGYDAALDDGGFISIIGPDDLPSTYFELPSQTISGDDTGSVTDGGAPGDDNTGRLTAPGNTITLVSKETTDSPGTSTGTYGVMAFDGTIWTYTLDDRAEVLADQQTETERFTFSDEGGIFVVTITITGANDAPTVSGEFFTRVGATGGQFILTNLSDRFTDVDQGDELTFTATLDDGAALSIIGLSYDPDDDEITGTLTEIGTYVIKIVATDKSGATVEATFELNILSAIPIIQRASITYNPDATSITIDETMLEVTSGNESDPALLVYTITTLPDAGVLSKSGTQLNDSDTFTQADINNGLITYVPNVSSPYTSQSNPLSFTISDGVVSLEEQTLEITSREVVGNTVYEGDPSTSGDLDVNDDTLLDSTTPFTISTQGTYGTASIGDDGEWVYKLDNGNADVRALNSGDTLTDTFVVDVNLASGRAKTQTVTITISGRTDVFGTNGEDNSLGDASTSDNQTIFGFNFPDILTGGRGDDLLVGGYGADRIDLSAGGADTVVYRINSSVVYRINSSDTDSFVKAEDGGDRVIEFTPGEDKLVILDVNGSPTTLAGFFDSLAFQLGISGDTDGDFVLSSSELDAGARASIEIGLYFEGGLIIVFDRVTSEALNDRAVWDTLTGGTNFSSNYISTVAQLSSLFGGFGRPGYDAALDDGGFISIIGPDDLPDSYFEIVPQTIEPQSGVEGQEKVIDLSTLFTHVDEGDELTFEVTLDDGAALSTIGLTYDSDEDEITGTLTGTGTYVIKIVATDKSGATVETTFDLNILSAIPEIQRSSLTYNPDETSITIDETMLEITSNNQFAPTLLVYTITTLPDAGVLSKSGTPLNNGDTFTQADINNGLITYVPSVSGSSTSQSNPLSFTFSDGVETLEEEQTLQITSREVFENAAPAEDNEIDQSIETTPQKIEAGDGSDIITGGTSDDQIDGGAGDDEIILTHTVNNVAEDAGADEVLYTFGYDGVGIDGGDEIVGFKRGQDKVTFVVQDSRQFANLEEFLGSLKGADDEDLTANDAFIVTMQWGTDEAGAFYFDGVLLHFKDVSAFGGGRVSSPLVTVTFDQRLDLNDLIEILGGADKVAANFDFTHAAFKNLDEVLPRLFGKNSIDFEVRPIDEVSVVDGPVTGAEVFFDIDDDGEVSDVEKDAQREASGRSLYITGDDGSVSIPKKYVGRAFVAVVDSAYDTDSGERLEGEFRSLDKGRGGIATPITDLIVTYLEEVEGQAGTPTTEQEVLDEIFGDDEVTLADVLAARNYEIPADTDTPENNKKDLISRAAIALTEIKENDDLADGDGDASTTKVEIVSALKTLVALPDDSSIARLKGAVDARGDEAVAVKGGKPIGTPDDVETTEDTDYEFPETLVDLIELFGFLDPSGNSSSANASAFRGVYIKVAIENGVLSLDDNTPVVESTAGLGDVSVPPITGYIYITLDKLDTLKLRPALDFNGNLELIYRVWDGEQSSSDVTLTITVTSVNDDPVATGSLIVGQNGQVDHAITAIDLSTLFTDIDDEIVTLDVFFFDSSIKEVNIGLSYNVADGIIGSPTRSGLYTIEVVASDNRGGEATLEFPILILPDVESLTKVSGDGGVNAVVSNDEATSSQFLTGGDNTQTLNAGDAGDLIFGGRGDDIINLGAGMDIVIYRYDGADKTDSAAYDGGDVINNFNLSKDILVLAHVGGNVHNNAAAFFDAIKGFSLLVNDNGNITGIVFIFTDRETQTQDIDLTLNFEGSISSEDIDLTAFNAAVDGRRTVKRGQETIAYQALNESATEGDGLALINFKDIDFINEIDDATPPSQILIGDDNIQTLNFAAGGDLIFGGRGDDIINLGDGADFVLYRYDGVNDSDSVAFDGGDVINNFDLDEDVLGIFHAEGNIHDDIATFFDAIKGVSLLDSGGKITGIVFTFIDRAEGADDDAEIDLTVNLENDDFISSEDIDLTAFNEEVSGRWTIKTGQETAAYETIIDDVFRFAQTIIDGERPALRLSDSVLVSGYGVNGVTIGDEAATSSQFLIGGDNAQTLNAGTGVDEIFGGKGDDIINLGYGVDYIYYGYDGADKTDSAAYDGGDVINNFDLDEDDLTLFHVGNNVHSNTAEFYAAIKGVSLLVGVINGDEIITGIVFTFTDRDTPTEEIDLTVNFENADFISPEITDLTAFNEEVSGRRTIKTGQEIAAYQVIDAVLDGNLYLYNNAPVADTVDIVEDSDDPITGTIGLANPTPPANLQGTYGALTFDADTNIWTYTLDNARAETQALAEGQTETETFTFTDATPDSVAEPVDVVITVVGVNDAPTVDTPIERQSVRLDRPVTAIDLSGLFRDVDAGDEFTLTVTGLPSGLSYAPDTGITGTPDTEGEFTVTVVATDGNGGTNETTFVVAVVGQIVINEDGAPVTGTISLADPTDPDTVQGTYGMLEFDAATNTWTYTLDNNNAAVQALAEGEEVTETFTFTDATDNSVTEDVEITVRGVNDAPEITAASPAVNVQDGDTSFATNLNVVDVDDGDRAALTSASFELTGGAGATAAIVNKFEVVNLAQQWTLRLKSGESIVLADAATFIINVSVEDAGGLTDNADVAFTVAPAQTLVDTGGSDIVGAAFEGDLSTSGDLDVNSDVTLASTTPFTISTQGTYGTASIGDDGEWVYTLDNGHADVRALNSGETLTDTFVVNVTSDDDSAQTQTITITISGRTDVLGTNAENSSLGDASTSDNQAIFGFNSSDNLTGGSGDDLLVGGYGADRIDLSAGGTDTVVYRINSSDAIGRVKAEDGDNTVMEFTPGEDKLVILDVNGSPTTFAGFFDSLTKDAFQLRIAGDDDGSGDLSSSELDAGARAFIQILFRNRRYSRWRADICWSRTPA